MMTQHPLVRIPYSLLLRVNLFGARVIVRTLIFGRDI